MYLFLGVQINQETLSLEDAFAVIRSDSLSEQMHSLTSGDLDEDGYGDIVIGTPYDSEVAYHSGKASIVMGDQMVNGEKFFFRSICDDSGEEADDNAGSGVEILNDSDENGAREVFISAPGSVKSHTNGKGLYRSL